MDFKPQELTTRSCKGVIVTLALRRFLPVGSFFPPCYDTIVQLDDCSGARCEICHRRIRIEKYVADCHATMLAGLHMLAGYALRGFLCSRVCSRVWSRLCWACSSLCSGVCSRASGHIGRLPLPSSHYYLRSVSRTSGTLLLPRFSGPPRGSRRTSSAEREPLGRIP